MANQNSAIDLEIVAPESVALEMAGDVVELEKIVEVESDALQSIVDGIADASVEHITLKSATQIKAYAFYYQKNLKSIDIPETVKSIQSNAFQSCSALELDELPDSIAAIGTRGFDGCTNVKFSKMPAGYTSTVINSYTFMSCQNITINELPEGIKSILTYAFGGCASIKKMILPTTITSISGYAFNRCTSLEEVHIKATTPPTGNSTMFNGCHDELVIYVPAGTVDAYKAKSGWSTYADKIVEEGA